MADDGPLKKKSRFFSGGKSLIGNIQTTLRHRTTSAPGKTPKSEDTLFGTASATFSKSTDSGDSTEDEASDESRAGDDAEPQKPSRMSTATTALENFSFNPNAARRQGVNPDAFKQLTSKTLLLTAAPTNQTTNGVVDTSSTNLVPSLMFSANMPSTRHPPTLPAGVAVSGRQCQEERQKLVFRNLPAQQPSSSPSQTPTRPPAFPNLRPQAQDVNLLPSVDPSKPIHSSPHLGQKYLRRPNDLPNGQNSTARPQSRPISNIPNAGISNLPLHATCTPIRRARANATIFSRPQSTVPPTYWTSPERVERAAAASRKRKRTSLILPPPLAYVYTRTNSLDFNIFPAILLYPELCFHLSAHLPLNSLVSLYAISRDFHTILDSRFTTVILSQSLAKAPESSRIFSFRCYAHLCRRDPTSRIPHPDPEKAKRGASRTVPSFRWLRMVLWREKVVHEVMAIMAEDGVPLPSRCSLALKQMWFILDIPDNARRIGYIHSNSLVADLDLYFMMCLFVKLDMRFNDPCAEHVYHGLRKLVLAQRTLTFLLRVLKRQELRTQYDVLQAWTRFRYVPLPDEAGVSIFGVGANEVGKAKFEYWGKKSAEELGRELQMLLRPEQLVMREAVRRGLRFQKHFVRSLLYGYVRPDTLENYAPRDLGRRDPGLKDEYAIDDEVGGVELPGEEGLRDPLLDLGERKEVSVPCVKVDNTRDSEEVVRRKKNEEDFLDRCMRWCRDERQWESMDNAE